MIELIKSDWKNILKDEFDKEYFNDLKKFIEEEYKNKTIYPDYTDLFNALNYTPYENVKVVILGQDPYHGKDQANGLAFSVKEGIKIPPSLRNIFKELNSDLGYKIPLNGDLTKWAKEGVLLLNTSLTVIEAKANSHRNKGWEIFTDEIIKTVNKKTTPVVFILWGNNAIEKEKFIDSSKHLILKAPHPSPLSSYRGFFDSKPFSKTNEFLIKNNLKEIDWDLN